MRVYLASTSPARRMLLRQAGIEPLLRSPEVDEDAVIAMTTAARGAEPAPSEYVEILARAKARATADRLRAEDPGLDALVVGGDSMFAFDGAVLGKPHLREVAAARWRAMRGRTGTLHSGMAVIRLSAGTEPVERFATAEATVSFAEVDDAEIDAYVATGEPLEVAGAFTLDALAGPFIDRVEGDPSTVVGMSLSTLRLLVRELGVSWPSLWNRDATEAS